LGFNSGSGLETLFSNQQPTGETCSVSLMPPIRTESGACIMHEASTRADAE